MLFVLFADPPNGSAGNTIGNDASHTNTSNDNGYNPGHGALWHWDGRLITSSDTLAQWVMTVFTIIAAGLLLGTLVVARNTLLATQNMARETTRIGEAQVRAYITIHDGKVEVDEFDNVVLHFRVQNSGNSPALSVWYTVQFSEFVDAEMTDATNIGSIGAATERPITVVLGDRQDVPDRYSIAINCGYRTFFHPNTPIEMLALAIIGPESHNAGAITFHESGGHFAESDD